VLGTPATAGLLPRTIDSGLVLRQAGDIVGEAGNRDMQEAAVKTCRVRPSKDKRPAREDPIGKDKHRPQRS
jgi:hypothetical protein